jgi:hypothetical protein
VCGKGGRHRQPKGQGLISAGRSNARGWRAFQSFVAPVPAHALGGRLRDEANRLAAGLATLSRWALATALYSVVNLLKPVTSAVGDCAINEGDIIIRFKPGIDKPA